MIYAIIGDVGSGKTLTAVRNIVRSRKICFCNFKVKSAKCIRLRKDDILLSDGKKGYIVNWEFWNDARHKFKNFDIYIDEVHNLFHSRRAMSNFNIEGTKWIAQIRKIMGNSKTSDIFLISQRLERIDVAWRDLLQAIIFCNIIKMPERTVIMRYHFMTDTRLTAVDKYKNFIGGYKTWSRRDAFDGSRYFDFYDTYEIIGDDIWL